MCNLLFVTFSQVITLKLEICPVSGCRIREGAFPQAVGALVCGTRWSWGSSRMNADPQQDPLLVAAGHLPGVVSAAEARLGSCTCRRWGPAPLQQIQQCKCGDEGMRGVSLGNTVCTLGIRPGRSKAPSGWSLGSFFVLTAAPALTRSEPDTIIKGESR